MTSAVLVVVLVAIASCRADGPPRNAEDPGRPLFSYSTSIVHGETKDGKSPYSSVKMNFRPAQKLRPHKLPEQQVVTAEAKPRQPTGTPQLFNVGYSIGFARDAEKKQAKVPNHAMQSYRQQKLLNGDIITGHHKDKVEGPPEFQTKETKYPPAKVYQQNYNPVDKTPTIQYFVQPEKPQTIKYSPEYSWKSPETAGHYPPDKTERVNVQAKQFDHAGALGRSQGFDHTNIMGGSNLQARAHKPEVVAVNRAAPKPAQPETIPSPVGHQPKLEYDRSILDNYFKNYKPILYHPEVVLANVPKLTPIMVQPYVQPQEPYQYHHHHHQQQQHNVLVPIDPNTLPANAVPIYVKKYYQPNEFENFATEPFFPQDKKNEAFEKAKVYHTLLKPVDEKQEEVNTDASSPTGDRQARITAAAAAAAASPDYRYYAARSAEEQGYKLQTLLRPPPMHLRHKY